MKVKVTDSSLSSYGWFDAAGVCPEVPLISHLNIRSLNNTGLITQHRKGIIHAQGNDRDLCTYYSSASVYLDRHGGCA
jgi:hypothetical protein